MMLYSFAWPKKERVADLFWKAAFDAEQNYCHQPMLTDGGEAEQLETCISRQAAQPQCSASPVFLSQAQVATGASRTWEKTQEKHDASAK